MLQENHDLKNGNQEKYMKQFFFEKKKKTDIATFGGNLIQKGQKFEYSLELT